MPSFARELAFAKKIAVRAGDFIRRHQSGRRTIRSKEHYNSLVTEMDHASEEMIVRALRREFPDHAVIAEEGGARGEAEDRWYVDPIDGTTNYAHGFPVYAVTLAYERKGRLVAGATYAPALGELYWASHRGGAFRNGRRIRASRISRIPDALLCTGFSYEPKTRKRNVAYYEAFLMKAQAIRRLGSAAMDMAWTASGELDGYWEFRLGPWDLAAGVVIMREAGVRVTDPKGGDVDPFHGEILAANPRLHGRMLAVLRSVRVK